MTKYGTIYGIFFYFFLEMSLTTLEKWNPVNVLVGCVWKICCEEMNTFSQNVLLLCQFLMAFAIKSWMIARICSWLTCLRNSLTCDITLAHLQGNLRIYFWKSKARPGISVHFKILHTDHISTPLKISDVVFFPDQKTLCFWLLYTFTIL